MGNSQTRRQSDMGFRIVSTPIIIKKANSLNSPKNNSIRERNWNMRTKIPTQYNQNRNIQIISNEKRKTEQKLDGQDNTPKEISQFQDSCEPIENSKGSENLRFFRKEMDVNLQVNLSMESFSNFLNHDLISTEMSEYNTLTSHQRIQSSRDDSLIDFSDVCPFNEDIFSKRRESCMVFK